MKLKIPGLLVTDAKSLFDHLGKTGSIPKEKQTLIDLLTARDLMESKAMMLRWMPNRHMLADMLTKKVAPTEVVLRFLREGIYSAVPSEQEVISEKYRLELRRAQRQRRKDRKKAEKEQMATEPERNGDGKVRKPCDQEGPDGYGMDQSQGIGTL